MNKIDYSHFLANKANRNAFNNASFKTPTNHKN